MTDSTPTGGTNVPTSRDADPRHTNWQDTNRQDSDRQDSDRQDWDRQDSDRQDMNRQRTSQQAGDPRPASTTGSPAASRRRGGARSHRTGAAARIIAAAVLVGGVAALGALVPRPDSNAEPPRGRPAPVRDASLVCPEVRFDDSTATTVSSVALPRELTGPAAAASAPSDHGAASNEAGSTSPNELLITRLTEDGDEPLDGDGRTNQRGVVAASTIEEEVEEEDAPPVVVRATGALAPGVTAGQLTRTTDGELRGLAETPCVRPGSEFWFVGTGSEVGRHGLVYLTNAEQVPARVNVSLYDETGPLGAGVRNLALPPGGQQVLELEEFAPTSEHVAVHVDVTQGRVAAALRDDRASEGEPLGVDWIPAAARPATDVVVPGVAPGEGRRVLTLLAPGDLSASVDVKIMGANGTFQPMEQGALDVGAGTVAEVDLTEALAGEAVAVRITADEPVVAGLRQEFGPEDGPRDVAFSAGVAPLTGPAVIPRTPTRDGVTASLVLSSTDTEPARATVRIHDADGEEVDTRKLTVNPRGTLVHELELPDGQSAYAITVTPERDATIYGARLLVEDADDGPLAALWPLASAPATVTQPGVVIDPRAGR